MNPLNTYSFLQHAAEQWPNKPAVHDELGTLTFQQLFTESEKLKHQLLAEGISSGCGIGMICKNNRNFIIALFASLGSGATVMPIAHHLQRAEREKLFAEANLHAVIEETKNGSFELIHHRSKTPFAPHVQNAAFVRFTSGTTGKSKGVIISHQSVLERCQAANKALQLTENDCVVWVLPMAYHFVVSIMLYVKAGTAIAICNDFTASSILKYANNYKGTLLYASPMHIRLLAADTSAEQFNNMKRVISTSTAIPVQYAHSFKSRYGLAVQQAFGIIEVGLPVINTNSAAQHPDAIGHALPDYSVEILDDNFTVLPPGTIGKLAVKGPGMFDAYLSPPQLREEILQQGWFITGDLASKSADGLLKIEGREKSMINVSGNKVFPEEVEAVLKEHAAVKEARVFSATHALTGEIVSAEIVLNTNTKVTTEELLAHCRKKLSPFKVPQTITFATELSMTATGKVKR
ncbi:MAG: class I adenylate-forming enzyme family protein [Bacteroidia bacterium]